jgi:two-component system aerobic respiration control sensor histidine kinase ArcB
MTTNDNNGILLENIMENMPGHIYCKDINGAYLRSNDNQAHSAGLKSASDIVGKTDFDFLSKEEAEKILLNDKLIMSTKKTQTIEEAVMLGGKRHVFLSQKSPFLDQKKNAIGVIGISIDITRQKELEAKYMDKTHQLNYVLESQNNIKL